MTTQSRIDAARANGSKSRGPVTPQGKAHSSANAFRHGLASTLNITVLPGEQAEQFQLLLTDILDEHQPRTPTELKITEAMALAKWRQMRAWEMSDACLRESILSQDSSQPKVAAKCPAARAFAAFREVADSGRALVMMNRYEARYERLYERSLKLLLRLRAESAPKTASPEIEIAEGTQEVVDSKQPAPASDEQIPEANAPEKPSEAALLPDVSTVRPLPAPPCIIPSETTLAALRTVDPSASPDPKSADPSAFPDPKAADY